MKDYLYKSGDLFLPDNIRSFLETFLYGSYDGTLYLTYWSILHFLSGVCIAYIFKVFPIERPYWTGFWIHTLWEIWQIVIGMSKPHKFTGQNNVIDILMDTILFMFGMLVMNTP